MGLQPQKLLYTCIGTFGAAHTKFTVMLGSFDFCEELVTTGLVSILLVGVVQTLSELISVVDEVFNFSAHFGDKGLEGRLTL